MAANHPKWESSLDEIKRALETESDLTKLDGYNNTILHAACEICQFQDTKDSELYRIIESILAKIPPPEKTNFVNAKGIDGQTALFKVCVNVGSIDVIDLLIQNGASVEITSFRSITCLHAMCSTLTNGRSTLTLPNKIDATLGLASRMKKEINIQTTSGKNTALHKFVEYLTSEHAEWDDRVSEFLECMIDLGALIHIRNLKGKTVFDILSEKEKTFTKSMEILSKAMEQREEHDRISSKTAKNRYLSRRDFFARVLSADELNLQGSDLSRTLDIFETSAKNLEQAQGISARKMSRMLDIPLLLIQVYVVPIIVQATETNGVITPGENCESMRPTPSRCIGDNSMYIANLHKANTEYQFS